MISKVKWRSDYFIGFSNKRGNTDITHKKITYHNDLKHYYYTLSHVRTMRIVLSSVIKTIAVTVRNLFYIILY